MKNKSVILELHSLFKNEAEVAKYYNNVKQQVALAKEQYNSIITPVEIKIKNFDENDLLSNIPYTLKDLINTKGIRTTGGCLMLDKYIPPYSAAVYDELNKTGAVLLAKDACDEFGLGGTGTHCGYGLVVNPYDKTRITAGSSSGSAVNVAIGLAAFALGTDTGDSVRHPASFLNLVGLKPSYGLVSRYGVFQYASSLDHVAVFTKYVTDASIVLENIVAPDDRDFSHVDIEDHNFYKNLKEVDLSKVKFLYFKDLVNHMQKDEAAEWTKYMNFLKTKIKIDEIDYGTDLLNAMLPAYRALSFGEATASVASFTGMTFGERIAGKDFVESTILSRSKYLGSEVRRRLLVGQFSLIQENYDELFLKAKKIRRIVHEKINNLLKEYDCIIVPGSGTYAMTFEEMNTISDRCEDILLIGNFTGNPSITIPAIKKDPLFLGINLNAGWFKDQELLDIALAIENINEEYNGGK